MNLSIKRPKDWLSHDLDKKIALSGFIFGLIALIGVLSGILVVLKESLALVTGCGSYLLLRRYSNNFSNFVIEKIKHDRNRYIMLNLLFFGILFISLLTLLIGGLYNFSISFFFLNSILAVLLLIDILLLPEENKKKYIFMTLTKIILLLLIIRIGMILKIPNYGNDMGYHFNFIRNLVELGHKPISTFFSSYRSFPAMHYFISIVSIVTNLPIIYSFWIVSFLQVMSLIFVFLIGKAAFNDKIGLLAMLLIGINDHYAYWGFYIIPMSFGLMLLPMMIYTAYKLKTGKIAFYTLFLIMPLLLLYSHTIVPLIFLMIIGAMYIGDIVLRRLFSKEKKINIRIMLPIYFGVVLFSYWVYATRFFTGVVKRLSFVFSVDRQVGTITQRVIEKISLRPIFSNAGYVILMSLIIIGILYWFRTQKNENHFKLIFSGSLITVFVYAIIITGARFIIAYRWWPFIFLLLSVSAAEGLMIIFRSIRSSRLKYLSAMLAVFLLGFIIISSPQLDFTRNIFNEDYDKRNYHTFSEKAAADTVLNAFQGPIVADKDFTIYTWYFHRKKSAFIEPFIDSPKYKTRHIVFIRNFILENPFFVRSEKKVLGQTSGDIYGSNQLLLNESQKEWMLNLPYNRVYDNGEVKAYYT